MSQEAKVLTGIGLVSILLIVGAVIFLSKSSPTPQNVISDSKLLVKSDSHVLGSNQAKVTIVEFGDYQCPACGQAHPIVQRILNDYKGKINFVFRTFAFLGPESTWAGEASECAGEQGKFWEYHDYLYEHQNGENKGTFSKENLKNFAKSFKLNTEQFNLCLDTDKYSQKVSNDRADGQDLGVNSTPTFFINGEKNAGVLTLETFKSKIDSILQK